MRRPGSIARLALAGLCVVALVAGCGGDDDDAVASADESTLTTAGTGEGGDDDAGEGGGDAEGGGSSLPTTSTSGSPGGGGGSSTSTPAATADCPLTIDDVEAALGVDGLVGGEGVAVAPGAVGCSFTDNDATALVTVSAVTGADASAAFAGLREEFGELGDEVPLDGLPGEAYGYPADDAGAFSGVVLDGDRSVLVVVVGSAGPSQDAVVDLLGLTLERL